MSTVLSLESEGSLEIAIRALAPFPVDEYFLGFNELAKASQLLVKSAGTEGDAVMFPGTSERLEIRLDHVDILIKEFTLQAFLFLTVTLCSRQSLIQI
jgi:hypothetical protein